MKRKCYWLKVHYIQPEATVHSNNKDQYWSIHSESTWFKQSNIGTLQPVQMPTVLCMQTALGFVTCLCYLISSEGQGRTHPYCPRWVQKLIPVRGPTTTKWKTTTNELNGCFIQVKATVKLPLSTYDTISLSKHYHQLPESGFITETIDMAFTI